MSAQPSASVTIRPYEEADYDDLMRIGRRIVAGLSPWLEHDAFLEAVRKWTEGSIAGIGEYRAVLVAVDQQDTCVGFVTAARHVHFTGIEQAYVGELAVAESVEGTGVGRALLTAAEGWAREQGYGYVALDTGADNSRARGFYEHLGYALESVRLVKVLEPKQTDKQREASRE